MVWLEADISLAELVAIFDIFFFSWCVEHHNKYFYLNTSFASWNFISPGKKNKISLQCEQRTKRKIPEFRRCQNFTRNSNFLAFVVKNKNLILVILFRGLQAELKQRIIPHIRISCMKGHWWVMCQMLISRNIIRPLSAPTCYRKCSFFSSTFYTGSFIKPPGQTHLVRCISSQREIKNKAETGGLHFHVKVSKRSNVNQCSGIQVFYRCCLSVVRLRWEQHVLPLVPLRWFIAASVCCQSRHPHPQWGTGLQSREKTPGILAENCVLFIRFCDGLFCSDLY